MPLGRKDRKEEERKKGKNGNCRKRQNERKMISKRVKYMQTKWKIMPTEGW